MADSVGTARNVEMLNKMCAFYCDLWGADKLYKLLSYGSQVVASNLDAIERPEAAKHVRAMGSAVSMARYVIRFNGTGDAVAALMANPYSSTDPKDATLHKLYAAQAAMMVVFHPLEHYSWIGYVTKGLVDPDRAGRAERVSCQIWALWIVCEFVKLHIEWKRLGKEARRVSDKEETTEVADARRDLMYRVAHMSADMVLAIHWSVKGGVGLSEGVVGSLGLVGAVIGTWFKWRSMS